MDTFDDPTKTLGYTVLEGDRLRQSLSRQHGAFQTLEDQNNDLLDVFRRTHVSDGFVCSSPDRFRSFTCGDEFHLGDFTTWTLQLWTLHQMLSGRRASMRMNCCPRRCPNSLHRPRFSRDTVNLAASASSRWGLV